MTINTFRASKENVWFKCRMHVWRLCLLPFYNQNMNMKSFLNTNFMSCILKQWHNPTWITLSHFFIKWMKNFEIQHVGNELSSNKLANILINSWIHLIYPSWNYKSIDHKGRLKVVIWSGFKRMVISKDIEIQNGQS